jgi:hypothetical protein
MDTQARYSLKLFPAPAAVLATLVLATLPAWGELPPLISREVLFGNPVETYAEISPNGKMLAYLAPDDNGVMNVWVRTLGQKDDKVVTADKKRGIEEYEWRQDSEDILYIQDRDGDEDWHVYQTNLKTKYPGSEVRSRIVGHAARREQSSLRSRAARSFRVNRHSKGRAMAW